MESLPLHAQVRIKIQESIERGIIKPDANGILPAQRDFAKEYNVGLMTIKRAIKELEQTGLVESRRGKGLMLGSDDYTRDLGPDNGSTRMLWKHRMILSFRAFSSARMLSEMVYGLKPKQTKYYYDPVLIIRDRK